jgi:hypothetical protein
VADKRGLSGYRTFRETAPQAAAVLPDVGAAPISPQAVAKLSGYQLTRALPRKLQSCPPTVEQMESELARLITPKAPPRRVRNGR